MEGKSVVLSIDQFLMLTWEKSSVRRESWRKSQRRMTHGPALGPHLSGTRFYTDYIIASSIFHIRSKPRAGSVCRPDNDGPYGRFSQPTISSTYSVHRSVSTSNRGSKVLNSLEA